MSAFARDLGLSPSFLFRLMNGERPLTAKLAIQLSSILKLKTDESDALIKRVVRAAPKNSKISKKFRESIENKKEETLETTSFQFEVERFKAISQWYHLAILNLTFTKPSPQTPTIFAKRLGISRMEAYDAIQRLMKLGLLEKTKTGFRKTNNSLFIKTERSEAAIREFQLQMMNKAVEIIKDPSQETFEKRFMPATTLAINTKKLPILKEKIKKFQMEIAELTKDDHYDEVYQFNLHLFPITKAIGEQK